MHEISARSQGNRKVQKLGTSGKAGQLSSEVTPAKPWSYITLAPKRNGSYLPVLSAMTLKDGEAFLHLSVGTDESPSTSVALDGRMKYPIDSNESFINGLALLRQAREGSCLVT